MFNLTFEDIDQGLWREFLERALHAEPRWIVTGYTALMCLIFVVSMVGNMLTCIVIYYDKTLHTATNYYLFNLAVSDMIVTLAILLEVNECLMMTDTYSYNYGETMCKVHFILVVILWNNGILVMTALAVERYMAICYPLMLKSVPVWKRVTKVICGIWVLAILETLPEAWTVSLSVTESSSMCFIMPTKFARILNGVLAVVTFIVPLGIMIFVYSMIAFQINVAQKTSSKDKIFNHRDNRSKVNKLITLTLSFLVCWVPFFTIRILVFITDAQHLMSLDHWWSILYKFTGINSWFSTVLNPLLFSLMSTKFRKALKNLWNRKFRGRGSESIVRATPV